MAKVKIQGHASGSGVLTVTAPNTSTDRTITLPDATGTLLNSDGSAASLTAIPAANITGTLPAIDGSNLTGLSASDATKLPLAGGALTGNTTLTTADTPSLKIEETGGSYIELTAGGSTGYIYSKTGHDITFRPAGTTQLVLTSGGRGVSQFTAKCWINFNGTGTIAIRDSHNVSSITDNATADYTVNFTANLANDDYAVAGQAANPSDMTAGAYMVTHTHNVAYIRVHTVKYDGGNYDRQVMQVIVFGD